MPADFWLHPDLQAALANQHIGHVVRAYRCHPRHGVRPLPQGTVATWLGLTQPQLSRIENGPPLRDLERLAAFARVLRIPEHLLWFRLGPASTGARGSASEVDDLAAMDSLRAADRQVGGGYLYATVAGYLEHHIGPRLFGRARSGTARVFTAAAGLTEMAGWMAHDTGRHELAGEHFQRALGLATAGGDSQLSAHVLASLSHLARHAGRPDHAIAYAQQGLERLAAGAPHGGVKARLHAMQARGHATAGDSAACLSDLNRAEEALDHRPLDQPSVWVSAFDEASFAGEAAGCHHRLGEPTRAERCARRVLELRPHHRVRSRAFAHIALASALVAQRRPDEASAVGADVLDATHALGSSLVADQLEHLGELLAPYRSSRQVGGFLDQLDGDLRQRRWLSHWLENTGRANDGSTMR